MSLSDLEGYEAVYREPLHSTFGENLEVYGFPTPSCKKHNIIKYKLTLVL